MLSFSFYGDGQCVLDIITWDGNGNRHIIIPLALDPVSFL